MAVKNIFISDICTHRHTASLYAICFEVKTYVNVISCTRCSADPSPVAPGQAKAC